MPCGRCSRGISHSEKGQIQVNYDNPVLGGRALRRGQCLHLKRFSYWDNDWQSNFGGVDDPYRRNGFWPADFKPRENPFYVALPYGEFDSTHGNMLRADALNIPWYRHGLTPLLKNRWVEINFSERTCFAQWEDVGPSEVDDFDYVFGRARIPRNTFGLKAGFDVSPAVWHYLEMKDNEVTAWRFVNATDVPPGPWTEIITTSANNRLI